MEEIEKLALRIKNLELKDEEFSNRLKEVEKQLKEIKRITALLQFVKKSEKIGSGRKEEGYEFI